jgi:hypothetical protein
VKGERVKEERVRRNPEAPQIAGKHWLALAPLGSSAPPRFPFGNEAYAISNSRPQLPRDLATRLQTTPRGGLAPHLMNHVWPHPAKFFGGFP